MLNWLREKSPNLDNVNKVDRRKNVMDLGRPPEPEYVRVEQTHVLSADMVAALVENYLRHNLQDDTIIITAGQVRPLKDNGNRTTGALHVVWHNMRSRRD